MKKKILFQILFISSMAFLFQTCAPVFSEMTSARTVGKDNLEITPFFSYISNTEDGNTEELQNDFGLQAAYGITPNIDIRIRYEYVHFKNEYMLYENGVSVLAIGPKFRLYEDFIAFSLPVGRVLKKDVGNTWQIHPTLILSIPAVKDKLDINIAPRYLITLCEDCDDLVAVNFGLALSSNLSKWSVRPEYGILVNPSHTGGHISHFSIGTSFVFGK